MQNWKDISEKVNEHLTVCLAEGIDQALIAQCGSNWFAEFAQGELSQIPAHRITQPDQTSVHDLDLQGLLKILRHRSHLATLVLEYHGFYKGLDRVTIESQTQQLINLLDRLIRDYRNRIEAHLRAADIAKELSGKRVDRIYGYEAACQDMLRLATIFSRVKNDRGVSYAKLIRRLNNRMHRRRLYFLLGALGAFVALALIVGFLLWPKPDNVGNVYKDNHSPVVKQGELSIQPIEVYYEGDDLVVLCYLINGTRREIYNIDIYDIRVIARDEEIAAANFGVLDDNLTIGAGKATKWQLRFPRDTILTYNAYLPDVELEYSCKFEP